MNIRSINSASQSINSLTSTQLFIKISKAEPRSHIPLIYTDIGGTWCSSRLQPSNEQLCEFVSRNNAIINFVTGGYIPYIIQKIQNKLIGKVLPETIIGAGGSRIFLRHANENYLPLKEFDDFNSKKDFDKNSIKADLKNNIFKTIQNDWPAVKIDFWDDEKNAYLSESAPHYLGFFIDADKNQFVNLEEYLKNLIQKTRYGQHFLSYQNPSLNNPQNDRVILTCAINASSKKEAIDFLNQQIVNTFPENNLKDYRFGNTGNDTHVLDAHPRPLLPGFSMAVSGSENGFIKQIISTQEKNHKSRPIYLSLENYLPPFSIYSSLTSIDGIKPITDFEKIKEKDSQLMSLSEFQETAQDHRAQIMNLASAKPQENTIENLWQILGNRQTTKCNSAQIKELKRLYKDYLEEIIKKQAPIQMTMLGCSIKTPFFRRAYPDAAEAWTMQYLKDIADSVGEVYRPGLTFKIWADGELYPSLISSKESRDYQSRCQSLANWLGAPVEIDDLFDSIKKNFPDFESHFEKTLAENQNQEITPDNPNFKMVWKRLEELLYPNNSCEEIQKFLEPQMNFIRAFNKVRTELQIPRTVSGEHGLYATQISPPKGSCLRFGIRLFTGGLQGKHLTDNRGLALYDLQEFKRNIMLAQEADFLLEKKAISPIYLNSDLLGDKPFMYLTNNTENSKD